MVRTRKAAAGRKVPRGQDPPHHRRKTPSGGHTCGPNRKGRCRAGKLPGPRRRIQSTRDGGVPATVARAPSWRGTGPARRPRQTGRYHVRKSPSSRQRLRSARRRWRSAGDSHRSAGQEPPRGLAQRGRVPRLAWPFVRGDVTAREEPGRQDGAPPRRSLQGDVTAREEPGTTERHLDKVYDRNRAQTRRLSSVGLDAANRQSGPGKLVKPPGGPVLPAPLGQSRGPTETALHQLQAAPWQDTARFGL